MDRWRKCDSCGKDYRGKYNHHYPRKTRNYCSGPCRQKAYRRRKRQAELNETLRIPAEKRNG